MKFVITSVYTNSDVSGGHGVAQLVAGSIPDGEIVIFPSSRTISLESTQPLTEIIPQIFRGVKMAGA